MRSDKAAYQYKRYCLKGIASSRNCCGIFTVSFCVGNL
jgi:hypothetical protein